MATGKMTASTPEYKAPLVKRLLGTPELGVLAAVVVFFTLFVLANKSMAEPANLLRIALQGTFLGIAAFGMSYLMIAGEIDLSSGATAGLAAAVAGILIGYSGWAEAPSYAVALLAVIGVALINSLLVLKIGMPSFFATLGTSFAVFGLVVWLLKGQWIYQGDSLPLLAKALTPSPVFEIPWVFLIYVGAVLIGDQLMRRSRLGPILSATGGNPQAAEVAGINVPLVKTLCFIFVSVCCGIAGILVMAYAGATDQSIGDGWLLWVIAIAIIGGGSLKGGTGSIIGGFLGVILIGIIRMGLANAQIQTNAQGIVVGVILIGAAALDVVRRRLAQY